MREGRETTLDCETDPSSAALGPNMPNFWEIQAKWRITMGDDSGASIRKPKESLYTKGKPHMREPKLDMMQVAKTRGGIDRQSEIEAEPDVTVREQEFVVSGSRAELPLQRK